MSELLTVCGLWENTNKNGETYFSGTLGNLRVVVLPNRFKESTKHPDFQLCLASREKKERGEKSNEQRPKRSNEPPPPEDEVPF